MRSGPNSARPRRGLGVVAVVLVALLLSQWSGWAHRIAHAPGIASQASAAPVSLLALAAAAAGDAHEHEHGHEHEHNGVQCAHDHDHGDAYGPSPEGESSHSCVLLDAAALGDGPPAQAHFSLRSPPPPVPPAPARVVVRALDCPAFAAARAPPFQLS